MVAIAYAIFSTVWIIFSDELLLTVSHNIEFYSLLQTYKGLIFIALSAMLIYALLFGLLRKLERAGDSVRDTEKHLHLALSAAGGAIWEVNPSRGETEIGFMAPDLAAAVDLPTKGVFPTETFWQRVHPDDVDCLKSNMERSFLLRESASYASLYRLRNVEGGYQWIEARGQIVASPEDGSLRLRGVSFDVSARERAEERLNHLLRYDALTGLANADKFVADGDARLRTMPEGDLLGVFQFRLLDLGPLAEAVGDGDLIVRIGERMKALTASDFLAARLAPDRFAVATPPAASATTLRERLAGVIEHLSAPLSGDGEGGRRPTFAVGCAVAPRDGGGMQALLRCASHALDASDTPPGTFVRWFSDGLDARHRRRTELMRRLPDAVAGGEIVCHFQPQVSLVSGATAGFEALVRWRLPSGELVPPKEFIGLAEETGDIRAIGEEVLLQACAAASRWQERGGRGPFVAVNVSPIQLADPVFPAIVARVLHQTRLAPDRLELEITESAVTMDIASVARRLGELRRIGVTIAIDDFGTGYSSLALLGSLPFTRLKIDQVFVAACDDGSGGMAIIDTIVDLCRRLDLAITAEGIETCAQMETLAGRGIELAQGYYFCRPVPREEADRLVGRIWPVGAAAADCDGGRIFG